MQPHPPFDSDARPSRLQRVSYNLDSDRLPPSASSSACSTPRSFNSYNGSLIGASNVRHLPADVQSPQNVVAQIRDAHKHMLALSRNNFAKPAPDSELRPQSPAVNRSGWQHDTDLQNEQRSLDSISELSDSRYQQEQLLGQGYQQPVDTSFREKELQQQNERLSRELVALNHDRDKQLHEQFKHVQEQQLQFEDLKQHASALETQLQESENSSGELLKVNQFLDAELKKHKAWLDQSQKTSGHYRHLFKQEEHERQQLKQQLHDTQSQLADTWRESSRKQELLAELEGQTAAAADHQSRAKELSEANRKLDITNGKLLDSQQALEDSNRDLGFQLDGLRSALTDALQEHEAAQESNAEQRAQQATHHFQLEARLADVSQQLEQAHAELHALPAQHAQHEAESASRLTHLTRANEQLQQEISSLDTQLGQTGHALHETRQSAQRAQQAAQDTDRLAELQGRNSQMERHIASLEEECSAKGSQVRQLLKLQEQFEVSEAARQAQHVGNAGVIADLTATNHQLQAQLTSITRELQDSQAKRHHAEDSKAAQQAQRAASDSTHTEAVANLTLVNGQLMKQISELNTQLKQAQTELHAATSAQHAQQADLSSRLSQDDGMQLQEQVRSVTQQLEQAQHELQMHHDSSAEHAQQHPSTSTQTEADEALVEQTSNLSRQLEQTKHDLHHVQDSNAAEHAQQAADSSEDITDLTAANSRLMEQVAESQDKIVQAQHEAAAATKKLQHMRDLVKAQHAKREEHAASLQTQLDSLHQECHRKDEQVQELQSKLQQAEASQPTQQDFDKQVKANRQFEDQIASIDLQLEQTQQELQQSQQGLAQTQQELTQTQQELAQAQEELTQAQEELTQTQEELTQTQEEVAASQAALQEQTELVASQRAQHAQQQAQQAASKPLEEECVAKALQVQQLLTQVDQLTDDHEALHKQVQYMKQQNDYVSDKSDQKDAQIVQLTAQLEALQQEHHRLTGSHMDQEKQNSLLQEECAQLQTYISALDEDLGKAQARMDGILSADGNSTSKQNEMLKAAAKQVIQIKAQDAPRSRMPRLLRKFSTRKKDKSAGAIGEGAVTKPHPQIHPGSPRAAPLTSRPQPQSPKPNPVSRSVSGVTTASQEAASVAVKETSEHGSSGGVTGPLTPSEQAPSVAATEAPPELHRLKEENSDLAQKLAQAKKDMAELNSRLVNAAFGNAFSGGLPESFMPSADIVEGSSQLDRQSSNPASEEQNSIVGLPPGVPLDTLYDD